MADGSKLATGGTEESRGTTGDATTETIGREEYYREWDKYKSKVPMDDMSIETTINDGCNTPKLDEIEVSGQIQGLN